MMNKLTRLLSLTMGVVVFLVLGIASAVAAEPRLIEPDEVVPGVVLIEQNVDESTFVAREVVGWTSVGKAILCGRITVRIRDNRGLSSIVVGTQYRIAGQISSKEPLTVTLPQADGIRPNAFYGRE